MIKIKPGMWNQTTKSIRFLSSIKLPAHRWGCDNRHYMWVKQYLPETYSGSLISPLEMQSLINLLCFSFNVPNPDIYIDPLLNKLSARTLFLDKALVFPTTATKGVVIHEFTHWYLWHKYRMASQHNTNAMKSMEYQLTKLIVKNINLGGIKEYVQTA